jgi:hypothetical protein
VRRSENDREKNKVEIKQQVELNEEEKSVKIQDHLFL